MQYYFFIFFSRVCVLSCLPIFLILDFLKLGDLLLWEAVEVVSGAVGHKWRWGRGRGEGEGVGGRGEGGGQ